MFAVLSISLAMGNYFEIKEKNNLNDLQRRFVDHSLKKEVRDSQDFYRFKSFATQLHWTYSGSESYEDAFALLQEAKTHTVYAQRSRSYTPENLVVFPNLNVLKAEQWHELLEHASESLLVGDVPQSVLEDCPTHEQRPKRLYISGVKHYTPELHTCFPTTELYFNGINFVDSTLEGDFQVGKNMPQNLTIAADLDASSATLLQGYTGDVIFWEKSCPNGLALFLKRALGGVCPFLM